MTSVAVEPERLDWSKGDGLLPAIVQHWRSGAVLMLGYMTREALRLTQQSGKVTFWSRSKRRLWTEAIADRWTVMFEHDATHAFGRIVQDGKGYACDVSSV